MVRNSPHPLPFSWRVRVLTNQGYSRPALVQYLPGGMQQFPKDDITEARLHRLAREQAAREGRTLTRRIPKDQ